MKVTIATRMTHGPTGSKIVLIPPTRIYRIIGEWTVKANARFSQSRHGGSMKRLAVKIYQALSRYLSTPIIQLFSEVSRDKCRSLLVQEYESTRFDLCVPVGRLKRIQMFGTYTGGVQTPWFVRPFRRIGLRLCHGLIIGARSEARRVRNQYHTQEKQMSLIYSPVDVGIFYPGPRGEGRKLCGIGPNSKLAIYHGRIELSYKGLDVLLRAWNCFCESRPKVDARLLVIGTGPDSEKFAELLSNMNLRGVQWINKWINDRNMLRRYLSAADLYVFPSRGDACPNALLEAMACGLPVVASSVNGIADILEGGEKSGGALVPPGDSRRFAEQLGRLMDDQELAQELGRRARHRVENSFSMQSVGKQLSAYLLNEVQ